MLRVEDYTEFSCVIIGENCQIFKRQLKKDLGAKYNSNLTDMEGVKFKGWIIPKKQEVRAKILIKKYNDTYDDIFENIEGDLTMENKIELFNQINPFNEEPVVEYSNKKLIKISDLK